MKKNNNSSIIISVLCGITVCFLCLGIVFLLPAKSTKEMKENSQVNQNSSNTEEINLGDCSSCVSQCLEDYIDANETLCRNKYCSFECTMSYCCCNPEGTHCSNSPTCMEPNTTNGVNISESECNAKATGGGDDPSGGGGDDPSGGGGDTPSMSCEDYDSAAECPSTCYTWGDNGCHSEPMPAITCWFLRSNGCYITSGRWSSCASQGYSSSSSACASGISCGYGYVDTTDQNSILCKTCPNGTTLKSSSCSGSLSDCCISTSSGGSSSGGTSPVTPPSNCHYSSAEACAAKEGISCTQNSDGCYVAQAARVRFFDPQGAGILATCYASGGHLSSSNCNPCCSKYTLAPRDNSTLLDKSYIIGERYFENSTSYYCAIDYMEECDVATPAPVVTAPPVIPKCYIDENSNYHWTSNPESSWVIATDKSGNEITNSNLCPPAPACYVDTKGNYIWGEYSAKAGYIYHAELTDEASCKKDNDYKCYTNGENYVWTDTPGAGYIEANISYQECAETPACYYVEKSKQRTWGYYSKVNGYYKIVDEQNNDIPYDQCLNDACYKCGKNYLWGDFSDEDNCEVVPSVTDITKCNNEEIVPPTGVSVSAVIYTFMAILMAFGIGFIYYSTIVKKND